LGAEAEQRGWKVRIRPVEVGCRGFVAKSVVSLLRELGGSGQSEENSEGSVRGSKVQSVDLD